MRRLILGLFFLVGSVLVALELVKNPAFLFVLYPPWTIEMPLWAAILAIFILFLIFYIFVDCIDWLQFTWYRLKQWWIFRKTHQLYSKTQLGLTTLIEGRYQKAERLLASAALQSEEPLMNYLGAAEAAHKLKNEDKRDFYLKRAYQVAPRSELAIGLTQAELQLSDDQLEYALATLNRLRQLSPNHPRVLFFLEKVYTKLADWDNLLSLLPSLKKAKLLSSEQVFIFEKNMYCEILRSHKTTTLETLHDFFEAAPRRIKTHPEVILEYVKQLKLFQDTEKEMEALIRKILKNSFESELVKLYGKLSLDHPARQLVIVGAWVKLYGEKPELLSALGLLCMRAQLWGKAEEYFEKSLSLKPDPAVYFDYGQLLEKLGKIDLARETYRKGLKLTALDPLL